MGKFGNLWKTMLAGGAGVAALAALNASIQRNASEPDNSALGGEAHFFAWKHGRVFYKTAGLENAGPPLVFIREVSGQPANVVASSLGAAYAIRVADEHPDLINALVLNGPTGSDSLNRRPGMAGAAFYGLLQSPVLGTSFYNVMASERSIRD